ncbi:MAG TPA: IS21 family transposase [Clostridia bacterium]
MPKIKEIIRLANRDDLSLNAIGKSVGCSHNTVKEIMRRSKVAELDWQKAQHMSDDEIELLLYGEKKSSTRARPEPDMEYIHRELKRPGVNLALLWHEYKLSYPDGVGYTQFCERYRKYTGIRQVSLHIKHKAGEKMFVDWAGDTMEVIDSFTGEIVTAYLFVATIGTSGYPYVEAFQSKEKESWIKAHINAFRYYGGLPLILVPDNDKSAVIIANKYDPVLNRTYQEMASHYDIAVVPARVRKPKDKPQVEKCVGDIETWIMAALRNVTFFSFSELNTAIRKKLADFSEKPYQKLEGSRKSVFLEYDKPALRPLPIIHYEYADWRTATVNTDYHVEVLKQYYSIPYTYVKSSVDIRLTSDMVEIYYKGLRICSHRRLYGKIRQYSTDAKHMPENHKAYMGMNRESATKWANSIGINTTRLVDKIFGRVKVEQQAYRSCMGLMRIAKTYERSDLEEACAIALKAEEYGCGYVERLLRSGVIKAKKHESPVTIKHNNIRGPEYYRGEVNKNAR